MKVQKLKKIISMLAVHFPDCEVEIEDYCITAYLKETPTEHKINLIPNAEYEEYEVFVPDSQLEVLYTKMGLEKTKRMLKIFGDDA